MVITGGAGPGPSASLKRRLLCLSVWEKGSYDHHLKVQPRKAVLPTSHMDYPLQVHTHMTCFLYYMGNYIYLSLYISYDKVVGKWHKMAKGTPSNY